jgi:hypothetical protein
LSTHRNTVKYRLQRIRDISGLDIADPDTRFNLQLATRAGQTLNALNPVNRQVHAIAGCDQRASMGRLHPGQIPMATESRRSRYED